MFILEIKVVPPKATLITLIFYTRILLMCF